LEFISDFESICGCALGNVASHFYEFSISDFDNVGFPVLEGIVSDPTLVLSTEDDLFEIILRHASQDAGYFQLLEFVRFEFLSDDSMKSAFEFMSNSLDSVTIRMWGNLGRRLCLSVNPPAESGRFAKLSVKIDSVIVSGLPKAFSMLEGSKFELLYRGTRDGFQSSDFHRLCNGHSPTLTVILSTDGSIFGGYTPVVWNSRDAWVEDSSLKSFLFTIKNPHNVPPHIFPQQQQAHAILDYSSYGPTFGYGADLYVCDKCQSSNSSYSTIGQTYKNDTKIEGNAVLTSSQNFTVKELKFSK
jgi:hypothetical protein